MKLDPEESKRRKLDAVFDGCFQYFPRALRAVGHFSKLGNDKHNPGEPLHWAKEKSQDQANCAGRHLLDIGPDWMGMDEEFDVLHAVPLAWRALALAETALEAKELGISVAELQKRWREQGKKPGGWVEWHGGKCPVDTDVYVDWYARDFGVDRYFTNKAGDLNWAHEASEGDIVKYRVTPPK